MENSQYPALPPPHGVTSNFEHPVSQAKALIVINALCITLMLLILGIRVYTKHCIAHSLGWDDCELNICLDLHVNQRQIRALLRRQVAQIRSTMLLLILMSGQLWSLTHTSLIFHSK